MASVPASLGETSSFIFQQYESKLTTYPMKLREPIIQGRGMLLKQAHFLKWTLFVVGGIAIVPTLFVCWMTFHRYGGRIAQWGLRALAAVNLMVSYAPA